MSDPEVIGDRARYAEAGREYRELERRAKLAQEWRARRLTTPGARELLDEGGDDAEVREMLAEARARIEELEEEIRLAMVERDPNDDKNVIVEIRAGAGGDEAGLFAGDLYRMLTRYAERRGFKTEALLERRATASTRSRSRATAPTRVFKYEGGTHRVQRVPETESQGRIHTSTATVAVLPEAEDVDVADRPERPADRRLPLVRARRAVGQHDRLGGAHHAQAERHRRLDAGREVAAAEPREGDAGAARAPLRARAGRAAGGAGRRPPRAGRHRRARREDPHLQLPAGPRDRPPRQAHGPQPRRGARRASSTSSPTALQDDEKRRAAGGPGGRRGP